MKILVVDDYDVIREIHIQCLIDLGFSDICEAENGEEAVQLAGKTSFQLILMDWNMPVLNGIEALRLLRQNGIMTPVIIITDRDKQEEIQEIKGFSNTDYLHKPFTFKRFEESIRKFIHF